MNKTLKFPAVTPCDPMSFKPRPRNHAITPHLFFLLFITITTIILLVTT